MPRRPTLPFGSKGPLVLGLLALALIAYGLFSGSQGFVVVGAVAALALLIAFPLADLLLGREPPEGDQ